ncbi:hypothetical protein [Pseudodonghicola xiamenensis]|uniref:Uncharacterized protein n=1 Tax=Pseudodonghicola xiamenensis TaxID=337702 RepID=A0A8J3H2U3_9RHOB|nr:hypothetical protein [Pseudodonghicola xiamenensis]GHG79570.1 hypothetical protein GCM10010961_01750 [Pseudodonghicola xiamenensis]
MRNREAGRYDAVVLTSAALPWMTGPSFISLWHACGLAALGYRVAYLLPWLDAASQNRLWGERRFADFGEQVDWLRAEAAALGCPELPECRPYRSTYAARLKSIVPMEDVFGAAPPAQSLIASEPEHLCWYPFTRRRGHIRADRTLGLSMTDYETYIRSSDLPIPGRVAQLVSFLHGRAVRLRIDLPLSLSPALTLPGLTMPVERITGVSRGYAHVPPVGPETDAVYFLGAFLWEKGLEDLARIARRAALPMDVIGAGRDEAAFRDLLRREPAPLTLKGPNRRFWEDIGGYRVMLNPSKSEVLCTATADALVAGRHVVLPECPGNLPFHAYPNAHFYDDLDGAVAALRHAVAQVPEPPEAARRDFDWMQACRRLAQLCGLTDAPAPRAEPAIA